MQVTLATKVVAIVVLSSALSGCDTLKSTYDSWFGAPAPSARHSVVR